MAGRVVPQSTAQGARALVSRFHGLEPAASLHSSLAVMGTQ